MTYLSEFPLWFLNHPKNVGCTEDEIKEMESFYGFNFSAIVGLLTNNECVSNHQVR
ncbi:hypothetical protein [Cellulophaga sp. BC115SP]|uniref:hypothetical protein n=1 Tax=Cellulophaga sp. BC115SP TaxID=2683263 RepID=UPI001413276F|nr:hypothetical protein [Cellulophaga sp. BC115SP]NBB31553.1 hypothetical protein [Cellulophaga sp. BC115SP]